MAVMGSKTVVSLFFFLAAIGTISRTVSLVWNSYLPDFSIFYQAVFVGFSKENPYLYSDFFASFIYPPLFLLCIYPFAFVSFATASQLWILISVFSLGISLFLLAVLLRASWLKVSIVCFLAAISFPVKFTLGMGQVNLVLLLCIILFLYFTEKKKILAAIFFMIAAMIKIIPLLFLYPLILRKAYRQLVLIVIVFVVFALFTIGIFGWDLSAYYLFHVFPSIVAGGVKMAYYNQSLPAALSRFGVSALIIPLQMIIGISSLAILWFKKPNMLVSVSFLLITSLLISSFAWQHHLVLLILPFFVLFTYGKTYIWYVFLFVSYILISMNIAFPEQFLSAWYGSIVLSHATGGMIILYGLFLYYLLRHYEA